MVCIYCAAKTQVVNSRPHDKKHAVWRRRACTACQAVFTTQEAPLLSDALMVEQPEGLSPFMRDRLFLSIYQSCKHREHALDEAAALTKTTITRLLQLPSTNTGTIPLQYITNTTYKILAAFDSMAAAYYKAYYID